jgi:photosystem II stability/assembly factor-like uncharacterized protein
MRAPPALVRHAALAVALSLLAAGAGARAQTLPDQTLPAQTLPAQTLPDQTLRDQSLPDQTLPGGAGAAAQTLPAALGQPALVTPRAAHALLLGLARAGHRLVAVGERGVILLSDDDGAQWRQAAAVPTAVTLTAVRFAAPAQGWAVGHLGVILHTADGGETWQRQLDGVQAAALMHDAAAGLPPGVARSAAIDAANQLVADGPDKPFLDLSVDGTRILAVGAYGLAVRSGDGGRSWTAAGDIADPQGLHLYALSRDGGTTLLAGEQGTLAVAQGRGPFRPVRSPYDGTLFGALALPDGLALAFGMEGALLRSDDAGLHWTRLDSGLTGAISCAVRLADGRLLLGSDSGELALGDAAGQRFRAVALALRVPITAMLADGAELILAGPDGPRRLALATLGPAT